MFNWEDFIDFAEELYKISNTTNNIIKEEALYRTIISRAYYGIFKQIEDYFSNLGVCQRSHIKIITHFLKNQNRDLIDFGESLDELKEGRENADYNANFKFDKQYLEEKLKLSRELNDVWNKKIQRILQKNPQLLPWREP